MQHIEIHRHIDASPQHVWDTYTDHLGWAVWGGIGRARIARDGTPTANGAGCVRVFGPRGPEFLAAHEEILEFEPPRRMTYRILKGGLPIRDHFGEVLFEPDGEGTHLAWRVRFESRVPGLGGTLRRGIQRFFEGVLDGMVAHRFPPAADR